MRHRLTAWMALFAMLTGIALPAHAYANHQRNAVPGADFCTTVKPVDVAVNASGAAAAEAPAPPDHHHAVQCDTCCGCGGAAAAPALPGTTSPLAATLVAPLAAPTARQSAVTGRARARGPPALA